MIRALPSETGADTLCDVIHMNLSMVTTALDPDGF